MTRWTKTLPDVVATNPWDAPREHPDLHPAKAIRSLSFALEHDSLGMQEEVLKDVRKAAAHLRAWRKSRDIQGERLDANYAYTDSVGNRRLIRSAILFVTWADADAAWIAARDLRTAETTLRVLGKRLMAELEQE